MRIHEVAQITGLTASNIRFYEKKGLLTPEREAENQYRDYTQEDVGRLKKILLYRKMDIPVEVIYLLQKGETSLPQVLDRQEQELISRIETLEGSLELVKQIQKEAKPEQLDVDYYLNFVRTEEKQGKRFAEIAELLEDFTEFTRIDTLQNEPYIGNRLNKLFEKRGFRYLTGIVLLAICILIPAAEIIQIVQNREIWRTGGLIFWIFWIVCMVISFILFRRKRHS